MGADGCAWMRWGAWGMGDTQTRQAGGIYGREGQDWGAMVGEISPDMTFFGVCQKCPELSVDGYGSVIMRAIGCMITGGEKKQDKKSPKWASRACFEMHAHSNKNQNVCRDGHGGQRG